MLISLTSLPQPLQQALPPTVALRRNCAQGRVKTAQNHSSVPLLRAPMLRGSEAVVAGVAIGRQTYSLFFCGSCSLLALFSPCSCTHAAITQSSCEHSCCALLYLDASGGAVLMRVGAHLTCDRLFRLLQLLLLDNSIDNRLQRQWIRSLSSALSCSWL